MSDEIDYEKCEFLSDWQKNHYREWAEKLRNANSQYERDFIDLTHMLKLDPEFLKELCDVSDATLRRRSETDSSRGSEETQ